MTQSAAPRPEHALFISHKHRDSDIADALRKFLTGWGEGAGLTIFQSSGFPAETLPPGEGLTDGIRDAVSRSSLLVLIYTLKNLDYETCILECGIALDPELPRTNLVVIKCTGQELPQFLKGRTYVDARDLNSVKSFVQALLTKEDYFAGASKALTGLTPTDSKISEAGEELFKALQPTLPDDQDDEEWFPIPYLQMSLPLAEVERIRGAAEDEIELARGLLKSDTLTVSGDQLAGDRVFEMAQTVGRPLKELLPAAARQEWVGVELAREVVRAARGAIPAGCTPVTDRFSKTLVPSLSRYKRIVIDRCMRFEFVFVPTDNGAVTGLPAPTTSPGNGIPTDGPKPTAPPA